MSDEAPSPAEFVHCMAFNLRSAARLATQHYDDALAPTGLKITQYAMLVVIGAAASVRMQILAQTLRLDPSTLSRTLAPLERDDLVMVTQGEDKRSREVALTDAGRRKLSEAYRCWRSAQTSIEQAIGDDRLERMVDDLSRLSATLS